jgi:hypothetical protein
VVRRPNPWRSARGASDPVAVALRLAKEQASSPHSLVSEPRVVYHCLHPHPGLSPVPTESAPSTLIEQRENESAWRQLLVQGVLAVLLPTEDLENGCLRALVAEIFAEMILGNGISNKACEGWLLWESITRVAEVLRDGSKNDHHPASHTQPEQTLSRLERFGLLSKPAHEPKGATEALLPKPRRHVHASMTLSVVFWAVVQCAFLAFTAMRAVIVAIATSSSLPPRSVAGASGHFLVEESRQMPPVQPGSPGLGRQMASKKRPIVSMKLWSCVSQLVELDVRMPWLSGFISMLHWGTLAGPGMVGDTDGVLDR